MRGFGGSVAGPRVVEVGEHVGGPLGQGAAELGDLDECFRDAGADRADQRDHQLSALAAVFVAVGGDHPLVDAPGGFDLDMIIAREQGSEPVLLPVGEEVGAGVQGAARRVERVTGASSVSVDGLLDASAASVEGVAGEADDVEGVMPTSA